MSSTASWETSAEDELHEPVLAHENDYIWDQMNDRHNVLRTLPRWPQSRQYNIAESKKHKQSLERNEALISKCCALFGTTSTPAELSQQTVCEKDRVAAFERLLDELMKDIDADALCVLSLYFLLSSYK